eukprot:scaffold7512_cov120-Isochrysis_galbana.AAC.3
MTEPASGHSPLALRLHHARQIVGIRLCAPSSSTLRPLPFPACPLFPSHPPALPRPCTISGHPM